MFVMMFLFQKENRGQLLKDLTDAMTAESAEGVCWVETSSGLGHPTKPTAPKPAKETHQQEPSCADSAGGKKIVIPCATGGGPAKEACRTVKNGGAPKSLRKPGAPSGHGEAKKRSANLHGESEKERPKAGVEPGQARAKGNGRAKVSAKVLQAPKSILLTPGCKESKEKPKVGIWTSL